MSKTGLLESNQLGNPNRNADTGSVPRRHHACDVTPGILPSTLRASLRLFKIAPGDFEQPLDFIAKLAALVPKPRVNLTRFNGAFAPNSKHRIKITLAQRGKGRKRSTAEDEPDPTPAQRRAAMTWAQRLKRVFNIDIDTCPKCGGTVKVIASIEDPAVIERMLAHLEKKAASAAPSTLPPSRAPPQASLFD